jgi:hypothetical protein
VKSKEEEERRRKIEALQARRAGRKEPTATPPAAPVVPPAIVPAGHFQIESLADRYRIHDVPYQSGLYVVDWSKELLENGAVKTQQDWITATQSTEWKIPSLSLYHATLGSLYRHKDHAITEQKKLVKEMQELFKKDFDGSYYMSTSTRIKYAASGLDQVTHDFGSPSAREHSLALVGSHAYVNSASGLEAQMEVLLGSRDLGEIENVYEWVSGRKPFLWRLAQAPAQDEERAAVLGCSGNGFDIYCYSVGNSRPSRGVVASSSAREISGGSP